MGMKGMIYAAEIFSGMMYDLLNDPKLVEEANAEFNKRTEKRKYVSPIE
jgi:aminobenzoyl-glutamate utilization protein B